MLKRLLPWLTAAVMFIIPATAAAQVGQTAALVGTVTDSSGAAIPGAKVTIQNLQTAQESVTAANESGFYTFPVLQPGRYFLRAEELFQGLDQPLNVAARSSLTCAAHS